MKLSELLRAAQSVIANPINWTQGEYTRIDNLGNVSFCAFGALRNVNGGSCSIRVRAVVLLDYVAAKQGFVDMIHVNDSSTHSRVIATYDAAIALAEALEENGNANQI